MAAKYPACGRAGLGNDRNPVGPPPPSTPPAFSSLPGPGTPPKSPIPPGCRRGDAPAPPPLTCTRASVRSSLMASSSLGETHTPPSARGTPKRCVSCVPPPGPSPSRGSAHRNPGARRGGGSRAGQRAGSGTSSWAPVGGPPSPSFAPPPPQFSRFPPQPGPRGPAAEPPHAAVCRATIQANRKSLRG